MRFTIITQNAPPQICGIGDHTLQLAAALETAGYSTTVVAREGAPDTGVEIIPGKIGKDWMLAVENWLDQSAADCVILQYTPLMFSGGDWRVERNLLRCWRSLARRRKALLIVHETYFRCWRRPLSILKGSIQKRFLKRFASSSDATFTASQPLLDEMSTWQLARDPILLPIGSNIPLTNGQASALRLQYGIADDEIVLTLFGGGNSLKWSASLINTVELALAQAGIPRSWLLLGGVPPEWFKFTARVLSPGRINPVDLSAHLRLTDVFLIPHAGGLSAKRGTLIAALQHGVPVVGTKGPMTDSFWADAAGITMVNIGDAVNFARVVSALCRDNARRCDMGRRNSELFLEKFSWPRIADKLIQGAG